MDKEIQKNTLKENPYWVKQVIEIIKIKEQEENEKKNKKDKD